jgi:ABC-2 type transport system permease protein
MVGAIFRKSLRDNRWITLGLGLMMGAIGGITILFFPTVKELPGLDKLIEAMPEALQAFTGEVKDFDTPEGLLATKFFAFGPIMLAIYAVQFAAVGVAGEEQRGTMDLLLSNPVPRWHVVIEKFAAFVVSLLGVLLLVFFGIAAGAVLTPEADMSWRHVFEATMNLGPIAITFGSMTFLLAATLSSKRSSGMIAVTVTVAFYMLDVLGKLDSPLKSLRSINPFYYYGARTLFDGMDWGNVTVLIVAGLVLLTMAVFSFERRDLAT